jgi:hypothetical protein
MVVIGAGVLTSTSWTADNNLGRAALDGSNVAGLGRGMSKQALLLIMDVAAVEAMAMLVNVIVLVFMIMIVTLSSMGMSMASKDEETDKVGKQASAADSEDKLGVGDLRGLDETSQGFENNGYAKSDEEDGIEEGTENLGSHPLVRVSKRSCLMFGRSEGVTRTPKVNSSVVSFWAATTAHKPITREMMSLSWRQGGESVSNVSVGVHESQDNIVPYGKHRL